MIHFRIEYYRFFRKVLEPRSLLAILYEVYHTVRSVVRLLVLTSGHNEKAKSFGKLKRTSKSVPDHIVACDEHFEYRLFHILFLILFLLIILLLDMACTVCVSDYVLPGARLWFAKAFRRSRSTRYEQKPSFFQCVPAVCLCPLPHFWVLRCFVLLCCYRSYADKEPRVLDMIELYEHLKGSLSDLDFSVTEDHPPPPPE